MISRPMLYRDAALADGSGPSLRKGVSVLVDRGRFLWIRPTSDEGELPGDVHVVDAGGSTIVRTNCSRSPSITGTSWAARESGGPATSGPPSPRIRGTDGSGPSRSAC